MIVRHPGINVCHEQTHTHKLCDGLHRSPIDDRRSNRAVVVMLVWFVALVCAGANCRAFGMFEAVCPCTSKVCQTRAFANTRKRSIDVPGRRQWIHIFELQPLQVGRRHPPASVPVSIKPHRSRRDTDICRAYPASVQKSGFQIWRM